jgi:hypothetical protein
VPAKDASPGASRAKASDSPASAPASRARSNEAEGDWQEF